MTDKCYVIPTQKLCNADCIFCISKTRCYDKESEFLHVDEKFTDTLHLLAKRHVKRFEITGGGEPFLNPELQNIIDTIRSEIPDAYIKLYTNGRILKKIKGLDEINISVVSMDKGINESFMKGHDKYSLFEKIEFFRKNNPNMKIRLSIPLIKGGIDTKEKLDEIIEATKDYGITYVVRTLYPHTKNFDENYVNFEYQNPLVTIEKNNGVDDFDGLILWSDGNIYTNWNLDEERKLYSYLLLKPDSKEYIEQILETLRVNGYNVKKILHVPDFMDFASKLYEDKDSDYYEKVMRHLKNTSFLFGNEGIILILDKPVSYEVLIEDTYWVKKYLRSRFSFTGAMCGFLLIGENISHLNLVHAPDPMRNNYERDLRYIESSNLRSINDTELSLIKKYRSYHI